jgi:hypothetical protein
LFASCFRVPLFNLADDATQPSNEFVRRQSRQDIEDYFFFFADFLFAVLRAVFFAADLVLAFALFAMLPS